MRVALFIENPSLLYFWQVKLIESLLDSSSINEVLLINNFRKKKNRIYFFNSLSKIVTSNIIRGQCLIEEKVFNKTCKYMTRTTGDDVLRRVKNKIVLDDSVKNRLSSEDMYNLINYKLDVILNLQYDKVPEDLVAIPKHGIWEVSNIFNVGKYSSIPLMSFLCAKSTIKIDFFFLLVFKIDLKFPELSTLE